MGRAICKALKTTALLWLAIWLPVCVIAMCIKDAFIGYNLLWFSLGCLLFGGGIGARIHRKTMVWKPNFQPKTYAFYRHFFLCRMLALIATVLPVLFPKMTNIVGTVAKFAAQKLGAASLVSMIESETGYYLFSFFSIDFSVLVAVWLSMLGYFFCRMLFDNSIQEFPRDTEAPSPKASEINAV